MAATAGDQQFKRSRYVSTTDGDLDRSRSALRSLDPGCSGDEWVRIGMAAKEAGLTEDEFIEWSRPAPNFKGEQDVRSRWRSFKNGRGIGAATLFHMARDAGWSTASPRHDVAQASRSSSAMQKPQSAGKGAQGLAATFAGYPLATADHPYIVAKRGNPDGLHVVPVDASLTIQGKCVAGWLAVPVRSLDGALQTIQYIPAPGGGKKLNAPGASFGDGLFVVGEIVPDGTAYIAEGIGQVWSCSKADYHAAAIVAFGSGRVRAVAKLLRERYPATRIVIVADKGKEAEAQAIARDVGGAWVEMPADKPANYDANDYERDHGGEALADLLRAAVIPPINLPLSVAFADDLPDAFEPPDELVQGLLTVGGASVLYGDSNSGKTFFVIDMAAAVARGAEWLGRQTEPGMVLYLAAESPASVKARLQAYQRHHQTVVPNFAIVQNAVNLFDGDGDTEAIIATVRQLEASRGRKVRLIVGDTLARMSAGANENAGQDMGRVIERFDRIRTECKAHFLLIHHSGKAVAAGARGWSGIRAAVDTEIEITDGPAGRCAEVTKQRDLSTKGDRIGFRLTVVPLGETKWGSPATSCVIEPNDAPAKPDPTKRRSEVEGAVAEYLLAVKTTLKKGEVVKHFAGRYESNVVYRAMKKLITAGVINEGAGMVRIADAVLGNVLA
ncbi:DNA primase [Burkholderia sp. Bp9099]|nr:DNA primase [Burkholderia sp. Bp9099]